MKIKMNKAAGIDEIQIEAWRYGGDKIKKREKLEGGFGWRDKFQRTGSRASQCLYIKKGDQEKVENYRNFITVFGIQNIHGNFEEQIGSRGEKKGIIPVSQAGFRKEKFTLDNIFVLNHIIQRKRVDKKESQKIYAIFIDLKSVFDNINRGKL